jgi:hypothetical protein
MICGGHYVKHGLELAAINRPDFTAELETLRKLWASRS